jgi:hypothetical protein
MDSDSPQGRRAAHETLGVLQLDVHRPRLGRTVRIMWETLRGHRPNRKRMPETAHIWLWSVASLDMVAIAWLIGAGDLLTQTSRLMRVVTLGGHYRLVLIMALVSFVLLAGLAPLTRAFRRATNLEFALLIFACVVSVVALAGAVSVILLLALACALAAILLVALVALLVVLVR